MKKILLLTDFSDASKKAISFAQVLFDHTPAAFRIVNTYPPLADLTYGTAAMLEAEEEASQLQLTKLLAEVTSQPIPAYHTYKTATSIGEPVSTAERLLRQEPFDFVLVGASGRHSSQLLGSTATGMIRDCRTNVLIVPAAAQIKPVREIVLAVNVTSINDMDTLLPLKEILADKGAKLTILTITSKKNKLTSAEIEQQRDRIANYLQSESAEAYIIHDDKVEHGINDYLDTHQVDLLVTIPHQKSLLDVILNTSVTRKLAFKPHVPILTLYEPDPQPDYPDYEEVSVIGLMPY